MFGYKRIWKSKVFTMGSGITFKGFDRIDIAGAMDAGTEFFQHVFQVFPETMHQELR